MATIINGDGIVTVEGTSTTQGRVRLNEDTDNGTNYVELQAPASVPSTVTFTLPSADGTNGQIIQTNGSGVLTFANAASLATPLTVTGNSTAGAEIRLPEDTDNGSNYVALKAADNLASNVTFTLPSADGTNGQVLQTNGSGLLGFTTNIAGNATNVTGTVAVANGGTGQTSLTSNNIILGNGTSAVQFVAPGTSGNVLTSNGTTWTSGTTSVAGGGTGQTSLTANNVILGNGASAVQFVAPGTNGNVLTSNGTTWQSTAPAGGGSWTYLAAVTASNSSGANLDYAFSTTYDMYAVVGVGIYMSGANSLGVRFRFNGSTETASNYNYGSYSNNGTSFRAETGQLTYLFLTDNSVWPIGSNSAVTSSFILYLPSAGSTSIRKSMFGQILSNSNPNMISFSGNYSAAISSTTALSGVQIFPLSGGVYGTFRLYGIKNS